MLGGNFYFKLSITAWANSLVEALPPRSPVHFSFCRSSADIDVALDATLQQKEKCTGDLGGKASTSEFAQAVIDNLK